MAEFRDRDPFNYKYALLHRDQIKRFGRFPGRNQALGRVTRGAGGERGDVLDDACGQRMRDRCAANRWNVSTVPLYADQAHVRDHRSIATMLESRNAIDSAVRLEHTVQPGNLDLRASLRRGRLVLTDIH